MVLSFQTTMIMTDQRNFQTFFRLKENKLARSPMAIQGFAMGRDHRKILGMISLGHVKRGRGKKYKIIDSGTSSMFSFPNLII